MAKAATRVRKTAAKTTAKAKPAKAPQPHGGALNAGGTPGNAGGLGRPPSEVRARCLGSFAQRIAVAEQIADNDKATDGDRLKALDLLGKYAGLMKIETETRDATLEAVLRAMSGVGPDADAAQAATAFSIGADEDADEGDDPA